MTRHWKYLLPALALALAACGNANTGPSPTQAIFSGLKARIAGAGKAAPTQAAPPITRASIANANGPLQLVTVLDLNIQGTISLLRSQNGIDSYISVDGGIFTMQNGIVINTHGFARNLLAHDPGNLVSTLQSNGGTVARKMKHFGDEMLADDRHFQCVVSAPTREIITILERTHNTRRFVENCSDDQGSFQNIYWMEGALLRQSNQWLGMALGNVIFQKLK